MHGPDVELAAKVIAENVISAFLRQCEGAGGLTGAAQDMAVAGLMRELLAVMPTDDGAILAAACNRFLDRLAAMSMPGPRVAGVDPDDGSIVMR